MFLCISAETNIRPTVPTNLCEVNEHCWAIHLKSVSNVVLARKEYSFVNRTTTHRPSSLNFRHLKVFWPIVAVDKLVLDMLVLRWHYNERFDNRAYLATSEKWVGLIMAMRFCLTHLPTSIDNNNESKIQWLVLFEVVTQHNSILVGRKRLTGKSLFHFSLVATYALLSNLSLWCHLFVYI